MGKHSVFESLLSGSHKRPSHSPTGFPTGQSRCPWWQASVSEAHPTVRRDQGSVFERLDRDDGAGKPELLSQLQVASYIEMFRVLCEDGVGFVDMWMEHEDSWNVVAVLGSERALSCLI